MFFPHGHASQPVTGGAGARGSSQEALAGFISGINDEPLPNASGRVDRGHEAPLVPGEPFARRLQFSHLNVNRDSTRLRLYRPRPSSHPPRGANGTSRQLDRHSSWCSTYARPWGGAVMFPTPQFAVSSTGLRSSSWSVLSAMFLIKQIRLIRWRRVADGKTGGGTTPRCRGDGARILSSSFF